MFVLFSYLPSKQFYGAKVWFRSKPKQLLNNWPGLKSGKLSNWGLNLWSLLFSNK